MPYCWFTLNRLGLVEEMNRRAFIKKYSVQFVTQDGRQSAPFYFFQHYDHPSAVSWQIERAEFDSMMLANARAKGAEVREGTPVQRVLRDDTGRSFSAERLRTIAARTAGCDPQVAASVRHVRASSTPIRVVAAAAVVALFLLPLAILLRIMARGPALGCRADPAYACRPRPADRPKP